MRPGARLSSAGGLPHRAVARQRRARRVHEREYGRVDHSGDRGDAAVGDGEGEDEIGALNPEIALTDSFDRLNRTVGEAAGQSWGRVRAAAAHGRAGERRTGPAHQGAR
ncbi:hypothetical protein ACIQ1J_29255 [Streptomyces sp. NPDC097107]|uniref:hypothetical protein n=1 Tax=Streptomyces sp. NPDC097107 TaxID=3366089 RepID=UPI0037F16A19